jgi:hypothetical protein
VVDRLVSELRPVRALPPPWRRLLAWLVVGAAVVVVYGAVDPRLDLGALLGSARFHIELLVLTAVTAALAWLALRAAVPGLLPARMPVAAGVLVGVVVLSAIVHPIASDVSMGTFLARGGGCLRATLLLGIVPALVLLAAVARGAPTAPGWTGALAGGAAMVVAYAAMRLHCPIDDGLHLLVWHATALPVGLALGGLAGTAALDRWSRPH